MRFFWQDKILYEKKSGDMTVQVFERDDRRELCFGNHIIQSAISLSNPEVLQLDYTRAMMAAFLFAPQAASILHFGLGAGSLPKFIHSQFAQTRQIVVEISPVVIEAAQKFFFLPESDRLKVMGEDALDYLNIYQDRFDLVFQDAFHANGVSQHLESMNFFQNIRDHLRPGGWLINNVWGSDRANLQQVQKNLSAVFSQLYSLSVRAESNVIFFAGESELAHSPEKIREIAQELDQLTGMDISRLGSNINTIQRGKDDKSPIMG